MTREIRSVALLPPCTRRYRVVISEEVREELGRAKSFHAETLLRGIAVLRNTHPARERLLTYLSNRYPYLHTGELSSFLLAVTVFSAEGQRCFFVTDDGRMRKSLPKLLEDSELKGALGVRALSLEHTGTIGLILRLAETGSITPEERLLVCSDLKRSSFRCSKDILNRLAN